MTEIEPVDVPLVQAVNLDFSDQDGGDVTDMLEQLAQMALDQGDQPEPIAAGTFALYPMADGGMMFVTAVDHGLMAGIKHSRIPPGLIRAMGVLMGGGSKTKALRALWGSRKAING